MRLQIQLPYAALATAAAILAVITIIIIITAPSAAHAIQSNDNLYVSAENPAFENSFAGSMVIEVMVVEPNIRDTDGGAGEPTVTINGETLRMAQARNGYWYGYFAEVGAARTADQISLDAGVPGEGLDFGVFCDSSTQADVLGASFSDSNGIAVPRDGGLTGFTNGRTPLSECTGSIAPSPEINNVLRSPPSINRNGDMASGQISLDENAWPIIQLFSFSGNVRVQYERAGGPQYVDLNYNNMQYVSHGVDREDPYPAGAEVVMYIHDMQLNQDPTDEDSWTFGTAKGAPTVFYQAFHDGGRSSADGGPGLVDMYPHLDRLGFDDNGYVEIEQNGVLMLKPNRDQPVQYVSDGLNRFGDIITVVENRPNSGIFESVDSAKSSTVQIAPGASRGTAGTVTYNDRSLSVLTGSFTASFSLNVPSLTVDGTDEWRSGVRIPITLNDQDQNTDPNIPDDLSVSTGSSVIPTMRIGSPLTMSGASDVVFYPHSETFENGIHIPSSVPDPNSARLHLHTAGAQRQAAYEMLSLDTGFTAGALRDVLVGGSPPSSHGTNWINADLRSIQRGLGADDIDNAEIRLYFGRPADSNYVTVVERGGIGSSPLAQIRPDATNKIHEMSSLYPGSTRIHMVVDLGPTGSKMTIPRESHAGSVHPIALDIFSFGVRDSGVLVNNAIYRLELEETSRDSGSFDGTLEFAVANQLTILDPDFIGEITATGSDVKFIVFGSMDGKDGITITYSDLAKVGLVVPQSSKTDITTQSGSVSFSSTSKPLRFGAPITVVLNDPDLNTSFDTIETYHVINDPGLPGVDTVGNSYATLLEIKFKDIRYKRCTIDGTEHGGLAATGFALVETGKATGVFEGVFKMPTWICDKSGSRLISTAGGSMDIIYHDARDASGNPSTYSLLRSGGVHTQAGSTGHISPAEKNLQATMDATVSNSGATTIQPEPAAADGTETGSPSAELKPERITLYGDGQKGNMTLSGDVGLYYDTDAPTVTVTLTHPEDTVQEFDLAVDRHGRYNSLLTLEGGRALPGHYEIVLRYDDAEVGELSFYVETKPPSSVPGSIKAKAAAWAVGTANDGGDTGFATIVRGMANIGIIDMPPDYSNAIRSYDEDRPDVPAWLKDVTLWWSDGLISDGEFVTLIQYMLDTSVLTVDIRN